MTSQELENWQASQIGKQCPKHSGHILKNGKYGIWCGVKTAFGYCNGTWPTDEWLKEERNGQHAYDKEVKDGNLIQEKFINE